MRKTAILAGLCVLGTAPGCFAFPGEEGGGGFGSGFSGGGFESEGDSFGSGTGFFEADLPPDDRPVDRSDVPPPPISGGTLVVLRSGAAAVASDPDRDRVYVVDLDAGILLHSLALDPGDEPGRLVEDADGRVHVVLRRGGAVLTLDPVAGRVLTQRAVCGNPRGIAHEAETDDLWVACAGGELVALPAAGGEISERLLLGPDLRDVVPTPEGLIVSRFRTAQLDRLDADRTVTETVRLGDMVGPPDLLFGGEFLLETGVAWRTAAGPGTETMVLHQAATQRPLMLVPPDDVDPYGGGRGPGECGGLVHAAVTLVSAGGESRTTGPIGSANLAVDAALSPDGQTIAVAVAGQHDPFPADSLVRRDVMLFSTHSLSTFPPDCAWPDDSVPVPGQVTAVAYAPNGDLVAQSREPAQLAIHTPGVGGSRLVELDPESRRDTGHDLFHHATPAEISCVSCHPEGTDDGRVWLFDPIGPRRSQSMNVGIEGTEPFHWDGDMDDLHMLITEVRGDRMGGAPPSEARLDALRRWLFSIKPPNPVRDPEDPAAVRGAALFEEMLCQVCHAGESLTNNQTMSVSGFGRSQVPNLHGIALRPPYFSDGHEPSLEGAARAMVEISDPYNEYDDGQIADLVAYLETL